MPILTGPGLRARLGAALVAVVSAAVFSGCEPVVGQTALVVQVTTTTPIDCLLIEVQRPGAAPVEHSTAALPEAAGDPRQLTSFVYRALVYSGGKLGEDVVRVRASGHRGGCETPVVAEAGIDATFAQGSVREVALPLSMVGPDADGDRFADPFDCRPFDPLVFPRAGDEKAPSECDGIDNNCDGNADEGCSCTADQRCYPLGLDHPTAGAGECRLGRQSCVGGKLGPCTDFKLPGAETCDGLDTDCDGRLDPASCPCTDGETRACYGAGPAAFAGVGRCVRGVQTCEGGRFGPCVGDKPPSREQCNGEDDDCDGTPDDPGSVETPLCGLQDGVCAGTRRLCANGSSAPACTVSDYEATARARGLIYRAEEGPTDCDGVDNDCDGDIDEGCPCTAGQTQACHPLGSTHPTGATGVCTRGARTCRSDGTWGQCLGAVSPTEEQCNGLDDDCDGTVDEDTAGSGHSCSTGQPGACANGEMRCIDGRTLCAPLRPALPSETCDGEDDDCDGTVDEGFDKLNDAAHCGGPFECTACAAGSSCCGGRCADVTSDALHCGGCGLACAPGEACCGSACHDLSADPANCGACGRPCNGTQACRAGSCVPAAEPRCNDGLDDDRDGLIDCADDDCAPETACAPGKVCRARACVPTTESVCDDRIDDDQDGLVDCEDSDCIPGARCDLRAGVVHVCRASRCVPREERACNDGVDDDADGQIDCADSDCPRGASCDATGGTCDRGACRHEGDCIDRADGDGDGLIDCADLNDCTTGARCDATGGTCFQGLCRHESVAQCANGLDDDGDGLADCADSDCPSGTACATGTCCNVDGVAACVTETRCTDGLDDDCDGKIDCLDPDCGCPTGATCCGGGCQDLQNDPEHCGTCATSCDDDNPCTTDTCAAGHCGHGEVPDRTEVAGCEDGNLCCDGACAAANEDATPGACTNGRDDDCDGLADCFDPDCACAAGQACCGGACRALGSDPAHCGACGEACPAAGACQVPSCVDGRCSTTASPDRTTCGTGKVCCGGGCVGGTETSCDDGLDNDCDGRIDCQDSDCAPNGRTWCPAANRCLALATDVDNCGECGRRCDAGAVCRGGRCLRETTTLGLAACGDTLDNDQDGRTDCADADCPDGTSCGGGGSCCGGACRTESCTNGGDDDCDGLTDCADPDCATLSCAPGRTCVGGACTCNPASCPNGCCNGNTCVPYGTQTNSSCGTAGAVCSACSSAAAPTCSLGTCVNSCSPSSPCGPGFTCCGGICVDVASDAAHCGSCTKSCATGELCSAGSCTCDDASDCANGEACVSNGAQKLCTACAPVLTGTACKGGGVCCGNSCGCGNGQCCNGLSGTCVGTNANSSCGDTDEMCVDCPDTQACVNASCSACTTDGQCATNNCADGACCPVGQFRNGSACVAACPGGTKVCGESCIATATACTACTADNQCGSGNCAGTICCPAGWLQEGGACVASCTTGRVRDGETCVTTCPAARPFVDQGVCIDACPGARPVVCDNTCQPAGTSCVTTEACTTHGACSTGHCTDGICCPAGWFRDGTVCVAGCPGGRPTVCGETCLAVGASCNAYLCDAPNDDADCSGATTQTGNCAYDMCCPAGWKRCLGKGCTPNCASCDTITRPLCAACGGNSGGACGNNSRRCCQ